MGLSVYSISPEQPFLRVLARAVLNGFPFENTHEALSHYTILVPNRRSARNFTAILLEESGQPSLLLPRIKPIGDIDEDILEDDLPLLDIPDAIGKIDHLHAILSLLERWAHENPTKELAQDIRNSGSQAFALAQSLQQLLYQFETEDGAIGDLPEAYNLDLAGHRQTILDILHIITTQLPQWLATHMRIGPAARRNMMIRAEALRISAQKNRGPIIAAGSTGTNPATRDLLLAIASCEQGAVVLPGLDVAADEATWKAIEAEHPQFSLKAMLEKWQLPRAHVNILGPAASDRSWLVNEALKPAQSTDQWSKTLNGQANRVMAAFEGVTMVEAKDRHEEAELIALRLRQHVVQSKGRAALVTPDRDLATRVKAALRQWNLEADDSAGESLLHQERASLLQLVLHAVASKFSAASLFAVLHHSACHFGAPIAQHKMAVRALDLAAYRGVPESKDLLEMQGLVAARRISVAADPHCHPLLKNMDQAQWEAATQLAAKMATALPPLADEVPRPMADHVAQLLQVMDFLSPRPAVVPADMQALDDILQGLVEGSHWHPVLPLSRAQHSILHALNQETLRPPLRDEIQLTIYGLAEARLLDAEFVILGGLVEGVWPSHPDSGPWLNRPMRESLKLQLPERDIGLTAHDFAQGLGHKRVMLTWPSRSKGAPAIPSRWVLRLQAAFSAAGLQPQAMLDHELAAVLRQLQTPRPFTPFPRPQPRPPVHTRPKSLSVSVVETLLRDSYSVYASHILALQPLPEPGTNVDAGLRGTLLHMVMQRWSKGLAAVAAAQKLNLLIAAGTEVFKPYMHLPEVEKFWWPRFMRMAQAFEAIEHTLSHRRLGMVTEIPARHNFKIQDVEHVLTARADRIDILDDGALRIIDYKSGTVPTMAQVKSGFAPQLTLEIALATRGAFRDLHSPLVEDALYIGIGGGAEPAEKHSLSVTGKMDIKLEAEKAFAGLQSLLGHFLDQDTPYIPRHNPQMKDEVSVFDHLSRRLEWQLQGNEE